jgi:hypothetical protein
MESTSNKMLEAGFLENTDGIASTSREPKDSTESQAEIAKGRRRSSVYNVTEQVQKINDD